MIFNVHIFSERYAIVDNIINGLESWIKSQLRLMMNIRKASLNADKAIFAIHLYEWSSWVLYKHATPKIFYGLILPTYNVSWSILESIIKHILVPFAKYQSEIWRNYDHGLPLQNVSDCLCLNPCALLAIFSGVQFVTTNI